MTGLWIALAALAVALGLGGYRRVADGRFRVAGARPGEEPVVPEPVEIAGGSAADLLPVGTALGEVATLVQFSSAFCAPCRATRRVLADVADRTPGVVHVEIDAELHLEVVRALRILRTPTTLVLDAAGHEVARAAGAPRPEQVVAALPR